MNTTEEQPVKATPKNFMAKVRGIVLPEEKRRPLKDRIDELAATQCTAERCKICGNTPPAILDAILFAWDDIARSGIWPMRNEYVLGVLMASGVAVTRKRVHKVLGHRRFRRLKELIKAEIREAFPELKAPFVQPAPGEGIHHERNKRRALVKKQAKEAAVQAAAQKKAKPGKKK